MRVIVIVSSLLRLNYNDAYPSFTGITMLLLARNLIPTLFRCRMVAALAAVHQPMMFVEQMDKLLFCQGCLQLVAEARNSLRWRLPTGTIGIRVSKGESSSCQGRNVAAIAAEAAIMTGEGESIVAAPAAKAMEVGGIMSEEAMIGTALEGLVGEIHTCGCLCLRSRHRFNHLRRLQCVIIFPCHHIGLLS